MLAFINAILSTDTQDEIRSATDPAKPPFPLTRTEIATLFARELGY